MTAKIIVVKNTDYAPVGFLICRVDEEKWDSRGPDTKIVDSDWEYPNLAMVFGWQPCHDNTDGTVDCKVCGKTTSQLISEAYDYLIDCSDNEKIVNDLEGQFFEN